MRATTTAIAMLVAAGCGAQVDCGDACPKRGWCTPDKSGDCWAASDDDCLQASDCRVGGLCAYDGDRQCVPTEAACLASTNCLRIGACHALEWWGAWSCGATSAADCNQSYECAVHGACSYQYPACY